MDKMDKMDRILRCSRCGNGREDVEQEVGQARLNGRLVGQEEHC